MLLRHLHANLLSPQSNTPLPPPAPWSHVWPPPMPSACPRHTHAHKCINQLAHPCSHFSTPAQKVKVEVVRPKAWIKGPLPHLFTPAHCRRRPHACRAQGGAPGGEGCAWPLQHATLRQRRCPLAAAAGAASHVQCCGGSRGGQGGGCGRGSGGVGGRGRGWGRRTGRRRWGQGREEHRSQPCGGCGGCFLVARRV